MIFIIGASASGKSSVLPLLQKALPEFIFYDFDSIGVPENADTKWRQASTEAWIKKITRSGNQDKTVLLGQMVPGEIVACPSADYLKSIHIILLDCNDAERTRRLGREDQHMLNWADWLRHHCQDPSYKPHVIKDNASSALNFDRWHGINNWKDWFTLSIIDTSCISIESLSSILIEKINGDQLL